MCHFVTHKSCTACLCLNGKAVSWQKAVSHSASHHVCTTRNRAETWISQVQTSRASSLNNTNAFPCFIVNNWQFMPWDDCGHEKRDCRQCVDQSCLPEGSLTCLNSHAWDKALKSPSWRGLFELWQHWWETSSRCTRARLNGGQG